MGRKILIGLLVTCLVLLSFHLMTGLYAKYSSTATGSDSARVAKFDVSSNYDAENKILTITNDSEVTVSYKISYSGLPTGATLKFLNETGEVEPGNTVNVIVTLSDLSEADGDYAVKFFVEVSQVD